MNGLYILHSELGPLHNDFNFLDKLSIECVIRFVGCEIFLGPMSINGKNKVR
jgi:hypothetical protein